MSVLKSVGVVSFGKIAALFGAIHGLIWGIFLSYFVEMMGFAARRPGFAGLVGIGLIIFAIIGGAVIGFIWGIIVSFLYNVFAGWLGGVEVDLVEAKT